MLSIGRGCDVRLADIRPQKRHFQTSHNNPVNFHISKGKISMITRGNVEFIVKSCPFTRITTTSLTTSILGLSFSAFCCSSTRHSNANPVLAVRGEFVQQLVVQPSERLAPLRHQEPPWNLLNITEIWYRADQVGPSSCHPPLGIKRRKSLSQCTHRLQIFLVSLAYRFWCG